MPTNQKGDLRARVIRLAHERPEMRPHLLPLLTAHEKLAWVPVPTDAFSFGFQGDNADRAGREMAAEVKDALQRTRELARDLWKQLAVELVTNTKVDAQPALSRTVLAEAFRHTYRDLGERAERYFTGLPVVG